MKIANDWSIACTKSTKNVANNVGTAKPIAPQHEFVRPFTLAKGPVFSRPASASSRTEWREPGCVGRPNDHWEGSGAGRPYGLAAVVAPSTPEPRRREGSEVSCHLEIPRL
jgi:hypothetical protein